MTAMLNSTFVTLSHYLVIMIQRASSSINISHLHMSVISHRLPYTQYWPISNDRHIGRKTDYGLTIGILGVKFIFIQNQCACNYSVKTTLSYN
jgi:hypothetical protein